jgi:hypothetical protein
MLGLVDIAYNKMVQEIRVVCMEEKFYGYSWHKRL